jgi:hypothetical protein
MPTVHNGKYVAASAGTQVITGAGRLYGILMSTDQATAQTVTFYDNTAASGTVILKHSIVLPTAGCPFYVRFPEKSPIAFSTGLHVVNANIELNLWIVEH